MILTIVPFPAFYLILLVLVCILFGTSLEHWLVNNIWCLFLSSYVLPQAVDYSHDFTYYQLSVIIFACFDF